MTLPLPMLAKPLPPESKVKIVPGRYVAEEKFNGHRLLVRNGSAFYDGELIVADGKHYDVSSLLNRKDLTYMVFDAFDLGPGWQEGLEAWSRTGKDCIAPVGRTPKVDKELLEQLKTLPSIITARAQDTYTVRRLWLERALCWRVPSRIRLAESRPMSSREEIMLYAREVWKRNGEGLIVKDTRASYEPGKRRDAFWKVKEWHSGTAELVDFDASTGEIVDRGPCATLICRDGEGNFVRMKTRDDEMCRRMEKGATGFSDPAVSNTHIGRTIRFDYTSRTPDGKYENPVFDRFEDE